MAKRKHWVREGGGKRLKRACIEEVDIIEGYELTHDDWEHFPLDNITLTWSRSTPHKQLSIYSNQIVSVMMHWSLASRRLLVFMSKERTCNIVYMARLFNHWHETLLYRIICPICDHTHCIRLDYRCSQCLNLIRLQVYSGYKVYKVSRDDIISLLNDEQFIL